MKILRCLPRNWREKVTAILEARDLDVLSLDELVGSLITHEMTVANDDDQDKREKKIKSIALKSSIDEYDKLRDDESEDMALITRKFNKFMKWNKNGGRRFQRRNYNNENSSKPKELIKGESSTQNDVTCFKCRKSGHIKTDCSSYKKEKKERKRAMLAA